MPDFTGKKVIVSMGREDDCKEFWHLIKCLYLIREKVPEAMLCIIGDGSFSEYKELAEKLGIAKLRNPLMNMFLVHFNFNGILSKTFNYFCYFSFHYIFLHFSNIPLSNMFAFLLNY